MAIALQKPVLTLQELRDPETGRLDASRVAEFLKIPLKQLAEGLGKNYSTVHKTPTAPALQPRLRSIERILEILEDVFSTRAQVLSWLNRPHVDLGKRTPLEVICLGYPDAVEGMLEAALMGLPS